MNAVHDPNIELLERIHRFVVAGESNELTDAQWAEFEQFLWENDDACRLYVEFNGVSALLPAVMDALPDKDVFVPSWEQPRNDFSIPGLLANAFHGTVGYFSQEIPFSLLVATVVTSLGLLIGSLVYVTHHEPSVQTATNSLPTFRQPLDTKLSTNANVVGRITGTYKCQWNGPGSTGQGTEKATRNFLVTLGDKIVLASGLLEITYDTGAKVILQGPIAYDVDSRDGGFLAIGKLTARLEKRGERRGEGGEEATNRESKITDQKSSLSPIHNPLFTVRTPTATVTDLGTEFGVEVSERGEAFVQVYEGKVACQRLTNAKPVSDVQQLLAGQSASISSNEISIDRRRLSAKTSSFVRNFPHSAPAANASPESILGYWRFEEDVPHPTNSLLIGNVQENVIRDHANRWNHLNYYPGLDEGNCVPYVVSVDVPPQSMFHPGCSGGAKSFNSGALDPLKTCVLFHNCQQHGYQFNFGQTESFTVEGFFKTAGNQSSAGMMAVVYKGCGSPAYMVSLNRPTVGAAQFSLFDSAGREVSTAMTDRNFADGRWHYFAARYAVGSGKDGATISLLVGNEDGSCQRTSVRTEPNFTMNTPPNNLFIGRKVHNPPSAIEGHFRGLIDEVRICRGVLSDRQLLFTLDEGKEVK